MGNKDRKDVKLVYGGIAKEGNRLIINGHDVSHMTTGVNASAYANGISKVTVDFIVYESDFDFSNSLVTINAKPVTEEIGRAIYESLKERYE